MSEEERKRLYLIVCGKNDLVYESRAGDEHGWEPIANSTIYWVPLYVHWTYNKGVFYIRVDSLNGSNGQYFKLSLIEKVFIEPNKQN